MNLTEKLPIVCLCGSTKFKAAFEKATLDEALAGRIVVSVACFMHHDQVPITAEEKNLLDAVHKRKIEIADEVFVLNVGGYIGESTRSEIAHARALGKPIRWLEECRQTEAGTGA